MATNLLHPAGPPRIPAVVRILSQFDRPKLEGFITVAISLLDVMDGDPDVELNGDEEDGSCADDDWHYGSCGGGLSYVRSADCEDAEEDDHSGDPLDQGEGTRGLDC